MGGKDTSQEGDGYEDLTKNGFIKVEETPFMNIKFYDVDESLEIKGITKCLKEGNNMIFIDLKKIIEDPGTLRIFINKIRRISDDYSITMKLYGKSWLLILPESVVFHVGDE